MIEYRQGDLLQSQADALAHGCNTKGRMHAGIAVQFRIKYPDMFRDYQTRCANGEFRPGTGYLYRQPSKPHIINLGTQFEGAATKEYVASSLEWLAHAYRTLGLESVAMPRIASGLGGLPWREVNSIMRHHFSDSSLLVEIWTRK